MAERCEAISSKVVNVNSNGDGYINILVINTGGTVSMKKNDDGGKIIFTFSHFSFKDTCYT